MCHLCELEIEMDRAGSRAAHPTAGKPELNAYRRATKAYASAVAEYTSELKTEEMIGLITKLLDGEPQPIEVLQHRAMYALIDAKEALHAIGFAFTMPTDKNEVILGVPVRKIC